MANYYEMLGVPNGVSEKEIRQAYRKLAREYHPDVNHGDKASEEKFKQINEAYSVLSDPENRKRYDKYGDNWKHADRIEEAEANGRRSGSFRWNNFSGNDPFVSFESDPSGAFRHLFTDLGQAPSRPRAPEYPVSISLEEAYQGTNRLLDRARGRRLEVKIPPGVDNGSKVHISPESGQQSDFYLVITVEDNQRFKRQGRDLYTEIEVPLQDVVLGGETNVGTLRGRVKLTIPPETQNGQRFRLAGQGMPELNNSQVHGDLFATVKVVLPTGLTAEQEELFRRLRESLADKEG